MDKNQVLLCWHAERAGTAVLVSAIKRLRNRKIPISQVLYLTQEKTAATLALPAIDDVEIRMLRLPINDPTSHSEILALLKTDVLPQLTKLQTGIHINISPGTPAMHAIWLVLNAGGAFPAGTQLWSSQYNHSTKRHRIDKVELPISTWMAEVRQLRATEPSEAVYEPEAKSATRRTALEQVALYARVMGAPLLILGERGIGKTRLVETLVATLKQRQKVITVPCGGLDSELADSLLFGHKQGAFTGAQSDRLGLLAEANGSILFLDEIQDLPKPLQRKLVRTLQDRRRRYRRIGDDKESESDFELVCASNRTIEQLQQALDADLFDRISHLSVELPPLRECREDIYTDWSQVWAEMRLDEQLPSEAPWTDNLEEILSTSNLTGNLRDLQRLALLIFAHANNGEPNTQSILTALAHWQIQHRNSTTEDNALGTGSRTQRLHGFRRRLANWAYQTYGESWPAAAKALECDPKTLREDAKARTQ